jgi:hypothetical protein
MHSSALKDSAMPRKTQVLSVDLVTAVLVAALTVETTAIAGAPADTTDALGARLQQALQDQIMRQIILTVREDSRSATGADSSDESARLADELLVACQAADHKVVVADSLDFDTLTVATPPRPADVRKLLAEEKADLVVAVVWQARRSGRDTRLTVVSGRKVVYSWRGIVPNGAPQSASAKSAGATQTRETVRRGTGADSTNGTSAESYPGTTGRMSAQNSIDLDVPEPDVSKLNGRVVRFALDHLGKRVGDGSGQALIDAALKSAGAAPEVGNAPGHKIPFSAVQPGDIVEFFSTSLHSNWPTVGSGRRGYVAIVGAVQETGVVLLAQCNSHGCSGRVGKTFINPDTAWMYGEQFVIYRPQPDAPEGK